MIKKYALVLFVLLTSCDLIDYHPYDGRITYNSSAFAPADTFQPDCFAADRRSGDNVFIVRISDYDDRFCR